jgi:hypothetical protein
MWAQLMVAKWAPPMVLLMELMLVLQRVQLKVVHWAHLKDYSMADPLAHLSVEPLARSLVLMLAPLLAGLMVY